MGCEVNIVCLEKGEKMLADKQEIKEAKEEGVKFYDGHSNEAIEGTEEQVTGLRVHEVESFYFDENRNLVENQVPDSTKVLECDSVVFASGQVTGLTDAFGLELNRFGYPIDPETGKSGYKTSIPGVFTAGDVITGTKFVIDAIAGAREVTTVIDQYLGGEGKIDETLVERTLNPELGPIKGFGLEPRVDTIVVDPETRMSPEHLWDKVDNNFTCEMAQCEAGRCLQCDLRVPIRKVEKLQRLQQEIREGYSMIDKNLLAANKEKCLERAAKLPEAPAAANGNHLPRGMVPGYGQGCSRRGLRQERDVP